MACSGACGPLLEEAIALANLHGLFIPHGHPSGDGHREALEQVRADIFDVIAPGKNGSRGLRSSRLIRLAVTQRDAGPLSERILEGRRYG